MGLSQSHLIFFLFPLSFKCLLGAAGIPWEQQQNPILSTASHRSRASQEAKQLQTLNVRAAQIPGKSLAGGQRDQIRVGSSWQDLRRLQGSAEEERKGEHSLEKEGKK